MWILKAGFYATQRSEVVVSNQLGCYGYTCTSNIYPMKDIINGMQCVIFCESWTLSFIYCNVIDHGYFVPYKH